MPTPSSTQTTARSLRLSGFVVILLLSASTSFAQGSDSDASESDELAAVELTAGETAPFSGQLLTNALAAELSVGTEHCLETKQLELRHAERACTLRIVGATAPLETDKRAAQAKLKVQAAALLEAKKQRQIPVWEEPLVVGTVAFAAGLVTAGLLGWASVWAVGQLRPAIPAANSP